MNISEEFIDSLRKEYGQKIVQLKSYYPNGFILNQSYYKGFIRKQLPPNCFFVFGSNPSGEHGPITAEIAVRNFGAKMGVSRGFQGQSYGIPTVALKSNTVDTVSGKLYKNCKFSKAEIIENIGEFIRDVKKHNDFYFFVAYTMYAIEQNSRPAVNLCCYSSVELTEMFAKAIVENGDFFIPNNVVFEEFFWRAIVIIK